MSTDLAWAAGFVDGEGCILPTVKKESRWKGTVRFGLVLKVDQVVPEPLEKLQSLFGGTIIAGQRAYTWSVYSREAQSALSAMMPYLVNKRAQAGLAILYQDRMNVHTGRTPLSKMEIEQRMWYVDEIKRLKYVRRAI